MALTPLELNTISRLAQLAKDFIERYKPLLNELNVIYDSVGGVKSTITQQNMDLVPALSGLTKQQLDDAAFVLTATIRTDLDNGISQLAQLAARSV